jgi:hypothetical protein
MKSSRQQATRNMGVVAALSPSALFFLNLLVAIAHRDARLE